MTHLFNDPTTFMEDALEGFLDANASYVAGVPGGVVRATETPQGKVAVFEDFLEFGEAVVKVPGVDHTIVVQTPAEQRFRPGDDIAISAPAERIYLFDKTTGDRLR